jgi:uncharacterized protein (DUF885 family)
MPIPTGDRPFDTLAAELVAAELAAAPVLGSFLGLTAHDGALPDLSAGAIAAREKETDAWQERFAALPDDELTPDERVDRDLVTMVLTGRQVMRDWAGWRRNPDDYAGAALNGLHILLLHGLRAPGPLAAAITSRLAGIPDLLAAGRANLEAELAAPELVRRAQGMARAGAPYVRSLHTQVDPAHAKAVEAAAEPAAAAFEEWAAFLDALAERASGGWAIGEARYDGLLRHAEGLGYGARELRERGAAEWETLAEDMRRRTAELRGDPADTDWRALLDELNADAPQTPEAMRDAYQEATDAARAFCLERGLVTFPAGEHCDVVPSAPFTRPMLAVAHYMAPPPFFDGGGAGGAAVDQRRGTFFVPYPPDGSTPEQVRARMLTNSLNSRWTIAVHEAYPGHHWHLAHLAANLPRPLRFVFSSTYFTEGWGLYVEDMMRRQGFYTDPRHELCQVDARLFRAARMVVDTSLHLGEMTIDEAVEHMSTKASLSPETAASEVLRYCAWPTQAASYLTGALEIARLEREWSAAGRGGLREFHDTVAGTGRLPISLVERCLVLPGKGSAGKG